MMIKSVLLDTVFLISLVDDSKPYHPQAREFYKYFLENKYAMILSSIACSEFCVKQPITDLPLGNFKMLSYNVPESHHLRHLFLEHFNKAIADNSKTQVKDDFKLISQASFNNITYIITEDGGMKNKIIELNEKSLLNTKHLFSPNGVNREFNIPAPSRNLFDELAITDESKR